MNTICKKKKRNWGPLRIDAPHSPILPMPRAGPGYTWTPYLEKLGLISTTECIDLNQCAWANDLSLLGRAELPWHYTARQRDLEGHHYHNGFPQNTGHAEGKGYPEGRVSQHAGPNSGPADEGEGAEEAKKEWEQQEAAEVKVTGLYDRSLSVVEEDGHSGQRQNSPHRGHHCQGYSHWLVIGQVLDSGGTRHVPHWTSIPVDRGRCERIIHAVEFHSKCTSIHQCINIFSIFYTWTS